MEGEHKQEDVRVFVVTPVVYHALDHLLKHDLVVQQSVSLDYKESVMKLRSLVIL